MHQHNRSLFEKQQKNIYSDDGEQGGKEGDGAREKGREFVWYGRIVAHEKSRSTVRFTAAGINDYRSCHRG